MERNYLIDTHCFIFWILEEKSLSKKTLTLLKREENNFYISSISILEIQYLIEIGKVDLNMGEVFSYIDSSANFKILPFERSALSESLKLSSLKDSFDRMIVSTAIAYNLKLITNEPKILKLFPKMAIG